MTDYAQISEDWQGGISYDRLTGAEELATREYINRRLREWRVDVDEEDLSHYINRAWDEWVGGNLWEHQNEGGQR